MPIFPYSMEQKESDSLEVLKKKYKMSKREVIQKMIEFGLKNSKLVFEPSEVIETKA